MCEKDLLLSNNRTSPVVEMNLQTHHVQAFKLLENSPHNVLNAPLNHVHLSPKDFLQVVCLSFAP